MSQVISAGLLVVPFFLLFATNNLVQSIPVDNGVDGEPEIECGPTAITVNFNTRNAFQGHVYVKGLYNQQECRNDNVGDKTAGISLPFDSCNVARTRSLNPRGIFVHATVVITFHPLFITKVDRAYRLQCFYMEADKTVSTQIEVSAITTAFATQIVPMPVCKYEILDGGPTGQPIQYATIGQQVYHKWTCNSETIDTFCAVVHSCTVNDGAGDKVQLINADGCAFDKYLLNNLEYPTDLMAGQETHVYKYADRSQLFYECQITITIKEPNGVCPRPECQEPVGFGATQTRVVSRLLRKRDVRAAMLLDTSDNTMDVSADLSAFDISEQANDAQPLDLSHRSRIRDQPQIMLTQALNDGVCFTSMAFTLMLVFGTALVISALGVLALLVRMRPSKSSF